ncbi:PaaI family thioesterase [Microbispora sp. NPDC049125]|uniref:PaaI family thioesterase n=1 Tax=Microbispora sp. NPDC049125 TaxID=3154929 RepID=UPI0034672B33
MTGETTLSPADIMAQLPFPAHLGIRLGEATPRRVAAVLEWAPHLCTVAGAMHGGAITSLADTVGGVCAYLNLPAGASTTTIDLAVNFFHGVRAGEVHATAEPLHVGATLIVVQTTLRDSSGTLLARSTQTQAVLRPRA